MANDENEKDDLQKDLENILDGFVGLAHKYPRLVHAFRYTIGAIYALHRSMQLGHKNRKEYNDDTTQLLRDIDDISREIKKEIKENKELPETDIWKAGFFCNASFVRVDAINERFLKAIKEAIIDAKSSKNNCKGKIDELVEYIRGERPNIKIDRKPFKAVRRGVVNKIKHDIYGQTEELNEDDHTIIFNSLKELLKLLEQKEVRDLFDKKYSVA